MNEHNTAEKKRVKASWLRARAVQPGDDQDPFERCSCVLLCFLLFFYFSVFHLSQEQEQEQEQVRATPSHGRWVERRHTRAFVRVDKGSHMTGLSRFAFHCFCVCFYLLLSIGQEQEQEQEQEQVS